MTAATKPIPNESAAGQGRAGMHAKAAESLCAGCLTKSKEKTARTARTLLGGLQTGKTQRGVPCAKNQRCMRKCRLCRKRAKNACEGRCNADGKECRTREKSFSQRLCGRFAEERGSGEEKERKKPAETFCFSGFGRSIDLLGRLQIFGWFVRNGHDRSVWSDG